MSEMSFEQMLEESFKTIRNGEVVEGTVIDVKPDEIVLNIGYKSDGIITRNEYTNESNAKGLKPYFQFVLPVLILFILIQGLI